MSNTYKWVFVSERRSYRGCMRQLAPQQVFADHLTFAPLGAFTTNVLAVPTPVLQRSGCIFDREFSPSIVHHVGKRFDSDLPHTRLHCSCHVLPSHATVACVTSSRFLLFEPQVLPFQPRWFFHPQVPNFHCLRSMAPFPFGITSFRCVSFRMRLCFRFLRHFPPLLRRVFVLFSRPHSPPRIRQFGCESSVYWIAVFPPAVLCLSAGSVTVYLLIQIFVTSFWQFRYLLAGPRFSLRTVDTLSCQVASVSPALLWEVFCSRWISSLFDCRIEHVTN